MEFIIGLNIFCFDKIIDLFFKDWLFFKCVKEGDFFLYVLLNSFLLNKIVEELV